MGRQFKPEQLETGSLYNISSSFAVTASYALNSDNGSGFPFSGSAVITGSLLVIDGGITGSLLGTSSFAISASYSATASYINNLGSSNYTQSFSNQSTWTVIHNLQTRYVIVQTYDTNFDEMIPQNIDLTDNNTVTISFPTLESGVAVVTVGGALQNPTPQSSSYALNASTASFVQPLQQSLIVTGSTSGNVVQLNITSNTASLDLSQASFYTLQLVQGTNTYINPSNIQTGCTSTLLISTTGSATVSFPSFVKQASGSSYTPTTTTGKDILTFISYDASTLYVANVKNLI
jgi:hypothetical protein